MLRQENFLLPPGDQQTLYEELASVYLELRFFAPHLLPHYFPAVGSLENIDRVLAQDVAAAEVFEGTRLRGADNPPPPEDVQDEQRWWFRMLLSQAERTGNHGNTVRSAILRQRAALSASSGLQTPTRLDALAEIEALVRRLQAALHLSDADVLLWQQSLPFLLEPAANGMWPVEARLLYDLQKICINQEHDVYAVDLLEWARSLGRRPIKRALPQQRLVSRVRYLRRALHRLTLAYLPDDPRVQLTTLLTGAIAQGEKDLRDELRPRISGVLDQVGLKPASCVERLERDRLVEELLDRAVAQGFVNMSDLRDAVARNRLKLPDLGHASEFIVGDPLLKANRRLAEVADGVYRGGEIYRRAMQRLSSVFFGNPVGRFLTRYLILPFGGAYLLIEGVQHTLVAWFYYFYVGVRFRRAVYVAAYVGQLADPAAIGISRVAQGAANAVEAMRPARLQLLNPWSWSLLGLFLLGMIYWPVFRRCVVAGSRVLGRVLRWPFWDLPAAVLALPLVAHFLQSRFWFHVGQFLVKPLIWVTPIVLTLYLAGAGPPSMVLSGVGVFALATLLLNSRLGAHLEEITADAMARSWDQLRSNWIPELFRLIVFAFRWLVEESEKLLYAVDEWFRFRRGDSRWSLVWKGALGLVWGMLTYVFRFIINLLVEPQINPIKHFPVVTVSHKLVLASVVPAMVSVLQGAPFHMPMAEAVTVALWVGFLIPGIFGFLAWELKENWRLYKANQSPTLDPVSVGHHGETVPQLLRPGFHSGTVPRLFARWRRNLRRGRGHSARRQEEGLNLVTEHLTRFIERSLLAQLADSRTWGTSHPLALERIRLATARIRFELACRTFPGERLILDFEEQSYWLLAGIRQAGWLTHLDWEQRRAFLDALAGFYKLAGVQLVREQLVCPAQAPDCYRITATALVPVDESAPPVPLAPLLFSNRTILWKDWVEVWERDLHGKGHDRPLLPGARLLP